MKCAKKYDFLYNNDFLYKSEAKVINDITKVFSKIFKLPIRKSKFNFFIKLIFNSYCYELSYHNYKHSIDVFYTVVDIMLKTQLFTNLSKNELFILLITTLTHDIKHTGFLNSDILNAMEIEESNNFVEDTNLCIRSNSSFNEVIHIITTQSLLSTHINNIYKNKFDEEYINTFVNNMILSTDLNLHSDYILVYEDINASNILKNKMTILTLILKAADLGHVLKDFKIHVNWVCNIMQEQNKNGHDLCYLANDTIWFNNTFTIPLYQHIDRLFKTNYVSSIHFNLNIWRSYI